MGRSVKKDRQIKVWQPLLGCSMYLSILEMHLLFSVEVAGRHC
jgi:hypothetical protein